MKKKIGTLFIFQFSTEKRRWAFLHTPRALSLVHHSSLVYLPRSRIENSIKNFSSTSNVIWSKKPPEIPEQPKPDTENKEKPHDLEQSDEPDRDEIAKGDDDDNSEEDVPIRKQKIPRKKLEGTIFDIIPIDSYGTNDYNESFPIDDAPLELEDRQTIAINWSETLFEEYYDTSKKRRDFIDEHTSANKNGQEDERKIKLTDSLNLFLQVEQLGPEDPWYCNHCKEMRRATKKFDLWKLPPILVVHLKRFSYRARLWREKLDVLVDFPIDELDLTPFLLGPQPPVPKYELYAVSNHYGNLGGGHYTAYCKNRKDKKWYLYDDRSVTEVREDQVKSAAAYVLFYRRKDSFIIGEDKDPDLSTNNTNNGDNDNNTSNNTTKSDDEESDENDNTQKMDEAEAEGGDNTAHPTGSAMNVGDENDSHATGGISIDNTGGSGGGPVDAMDEGN